MNDSRSLLQEQGPAPAGWLVALVHTADAVQVTGVATSAGGLERRVATSVRRRAGDRLWAADAAYFRGVGRRWDQERLVVERLNPELRGEALDG
jgi:hypothetical protein